MGSSDGAVTVGPDCVHEDQKACSSSEYAVRDFITEHPAFKFGLREYIEATRYTAVALKRFASFTRTFSVAARSTSPWEGKRETFKRAARAVRAYATVDWEREDYWRTIPVVDKASVRADPEAFLNSGLNRTLWWESPTSGTSGPPLTVWYAPQFHVEVRLFAMRRIAWVAGVNVEDLLSQPVFSIFAVSNHNHHQAGRVDASPDRSRGLSLTISADERIPGSIAALVDALDCHRPAILAVTPNSLGSILHYLADSNRTTTGRLKLLVSSGAQLDPELRPVAERAMGAPLCDTYALNEFGPVASECAAQDGFHLFEHDMVAEILGPDGFLADEGFGELVLSSVANLAMPLLRYRTGDVGEVTSEPCVCGKAGRRIRRLGGRLVPNFRLPDGTEYCPTHFGELFRIFPLREYRLIQVDLKRLDAEVELLETCANSSEILAQIRDYIATELRALLQVRVIPRSFPPAERLQRYARLF